MQKIKLLEGDLKALKGQAALKTEFTHDNMMVGEEMTEKESLADKKSKLDEKEPGRAAQWEKAWVADRKDRFDPQFRELFAKHSGMSTSGRKCTVHPYFQNNAH